MASSSINACAFKAQLNSRMTAVQSMRSLPLRTKVLSALDGLTAKFDRMDDGLKPRFAEVLSPLTGMEDPKAFSRAVVLLSKQLEKVKTYPDLFLYAKMGPLRTGLERLSEAVAEKTSEQGEYDFVSDEIPVLYKPAEISASQHWSAAALFEAFRTIEKSGWSESDPDMFRHTTSVSLDAAPCKDAVANANSITGAMTLFTRETDRMIGKWGNDLTDEEKTLILSAIIVHEDRHSWQCATHFPNFWHGEYSYLNLAEADAFLHQYRYLIVYHLMDHSHKIIPRFNYWHDYFMPFLAKKAPRSEGPDAEQARKTVQKGWEELDGIQGNLRFLSRFKEMLLNPN